MIWADRVGLVVALIVWGFVAATGQMSDPKASTVAVWVTLFPWLFMRALDFIFSGRLRSR